MLFRSVTIVISEGIYFVVDDYTNLLIDDVKTLLEDANITIRTENEPNATVKPGTILRQEILSEGTKLDPKRQYEIKFYVASNIEFIIPTTILGMDIQSAKSMLESDSYGAKVTLSQKSTEGMSEEEIAALVRNVVIEASPNVGSYYVQGETNDITLYYY